jgi:hypothetical protein
MDVVVIAGLMEEVSRIFANVGRFPNFVLVLWQGEGRNFGVIGKICAHVLQNNTRAYAFVGNPYDLGGVNHAIDAWDDLAFPVDIFAGFVFLGDAHVVQGDQLPLVIEYRASAAARRRVGFVPNGGRRNAHKKIFADGKLLVVAVGMVDDVESLVPFFAEFALGLVECDVADGLNPDLSRDVHRFDRQKTIVQFLT